METTTGGTAVLDRTDSMTTNCEPTIFDDTGQTGGTTDTDYNRIAAVTNGDAGFDPDTGTTVDDTDDWLGDGPPNDDFDLEDDMKVTAEDDGDAEQSEESGDDAEDVATETATA